MVACLQQLPLREAAVTPNTKRTQLLRGVCGSEPRNDELAGAETVFMVECNMCNAAMRGIVVPPGSRATSRANGSRRNLGYPASDHRPCADLVRIAVVQRTEEAWSSPPVSR